MASMTPTPPVADTIACKETELKCQWRYFTDRCLDPHGRKDVCPEMIRQEQRHKARLEELMLADKIASLHDQRVKLAAKQRASLIHPRVVPSN